jgi:hypothetical protein
VKSIENSLPFWLLACFGFGCSGTDQILGVEPDASSPATFGSVAVNCDGGPNFTGCPCNPGDQRTCYTGPPETETVLPCRSGIQTCQLVSEVTYAYGACEGETVPTAGATCGASGPGGTDAGGPNPLCASRGCGNDGGVSLDAGAPCTDSSQCAPGVTCAYLIRDGCGAKGQCLGLPLCNSFYPGCTCAGTTINIACSGLAPQPVAHTGACADGG